MLHSKSPPLPSFHHTVPGAPPLPSFPNVVASSAAAAAALLQHSAGTFLSGYYSWFPPGLEIGETWKNGKAFSSQGKVTEFCQDWKSQNFTQNTGKFEKLYWKIEKNTGKVGQICQPVIVKTL